MFKKIWISYSKVILISIVGSFLITYFTCQSCHTDVERYLWGTFFSSLLWISLWIGNELLSIYVTSRIPWVQYPIKRLVVGVVSTVIFTVTVVLSIVVVWERAMNFSFGGRYAIVLSSLTITFFISLFLQGRGFLLSWKEAAVAAEAANKESIKAQYESLKSQVNPHFLFNSLNALTNLVYEDQDKAAKFIKQLSEVYRYVLDTREKEVVPIGDELRFLESYFFLQKIRFGENLKVVNELQAAISMIVPLALQLLVENAIKHNVVSTDDPLTIKLYREDNFIVVENNLKKKTMLGENSNGIGIDNIKKRYQFLTNLDVVVVEDNERFMVKLPIIEIERG